MDSIYDILKRYEFDKTEAETLQGLVKKAMEKGGAAQQELKNLAKASATLAAEALASGLVVARSPAKLPEPTPPLAGIDGSCQQVGGFGGKWYVPVSCAIIKALQGSITKLDVDVIANIEEIQQREFQNVGADVSRIMMTVETKAIATWAQQAPPNSYALLDGPVIDPPSEKDPAYVNLRSAALKACAAKKVQVVGCVKRSFDATFKDHARQLWAASKPQLDPLLSLFPSDAHLLTFLMSALARPLPEGHWLHTKVLPMADNEVIHLYADQGVRIVFAYVQRDIGTSLLRVEVVIPESTKDADIAAFASPILELCVATTYPGHYVPLVVQMAHDKCNIREGCAEVLWEEIMTRARASEPLEQIVISKMR